MSENEIKIPDPAPFFEYILHLIQEQQKMSKSIEMITKILITKEVNNELK
ncbi:MAG TPA: hypothetical protein VII94_00090 [Candidatus Saccharimonadales bacterium]